MKMRATIRVWSLAVAGLLLAAGCTTLSSGRKGAPVEWSCPTWFSAPRGAEGAEAAVSFDMGLPSHLKPYRSKYHLPGWVIYGVVRCLGSDEFLAQGVCRTYRLRDEGGETQVVVDNTWYDVSPAAVDAQLAEIAGQYGAAVTERDRQNVLGRYVKRRHGGNLLFSLGAGDMVEFTGNLLQQSGATEDPMEKFVRGVTAGLPKPGWQETGREYLVTGAGQFRYGDPISSFRKTEEDAILELAKSLVLKLSHMEKSLTIGTGQSGTDDMLEEAQREEVHLRMRGLRVIRRAVDLENGICLVTISVPRNGVARR